MKKIFIATIKITVAVLLFRLGNRVVSQTWPMQGATWRYCITNWVELPAGYNELRVVGDTIIEGNTYSIIQGGF